MALHEITQARDELLGIADDLESIDFAFPTEPSDEASQEDWRDYALDLNLRLSYAEKAVEKAVNQINS
jgi:hypothetical protein